jgi:hypothetical protein
MGCAFSPGPVERLRIWFGAAFERTGRAGVMTLYYVDQTYPVRSSLSPLDNSPTTATSLGAPRCTVSGAPSAPLHH